MPAPGAPQRREVDVGHHDERRRVRQLRHVRRERRAALALGAKREAEAHGPVRRERQQIEVGKVRAELEVCRQHDEWRAGRRVAGDAQPAHARDFADGEGWVDEGAAGAGPGEEVVHGGEA